MARGLHRLLGLAKGLSDSPPAGEECVLARKLRIVVLFGSASTEHDVSVVSAQQVMDALDPAAYDVIPVYLDFQNRMLAGEGLRSIENFRPNPKGLINVRPVWGSLGPILRASGNGPDIAFDCALPVFHGAFGEDGKIQGLFELEGIPFTGFRASDAAIAMRKDLTKLAVGERGVRVLPHILVNRQQISGWRDIASSVEEAFGFPVIVKPASLGSSIGVAQARTRDELFGVLSFVLANDFLALVEPKVANLIEYNVAVRASFGTAICSAVERPKTSADLLDFKEKYLSGAGERGGSKVRSQGMLSLTRELNPYLPSHLGDELHRYAREAFFALGSRGAPRIDFLSDGQTGEIWFNEINPIPGSYGFFLWENAPMNPMLFPDLLDCLITEAMETTVKTFDDPVPAAARLLPR